MPAGKKQQFLFKGKTEDHSIVIGSHGDVIIQATGEFDLSGTIYCPKYTVTFVVDGTGTMTFRGICHKIIIKKMTGKTLLDLTDLTCKEFQCDSLRQHAKIITGKVRTITRANLKDQAILQLSEKPLLSSSFIASGDSQIIQPDQATDKVTI